MFRHWPAGPAAIFSARTRFTQEQATSCCQRRMHPHAFTPFDKLKFMSTKNRKGQHCAHPAREAYAQRGETQIAQESSRTQHTRQQSSTRSSERPKRKAPRKLDRASLTAPRICACRLPKRSKQVRESVEMIGRSQPQIKCKRNTIEANLEQSLRCSQNTTNAIVLHLARLLQCVGAKSLSCQLQSISNSKVSSNGPGVQV